MTDQDKTAFSDALAALGAAFGAPPALPVLQAYWQFLRDLALPDFLRAVQQAGRTLKWFPKPAELRELAGDNLKAEVAIAWGAVRAAMDKYDYTTSVDFGPLVNAVVHNLGGWIALCNASIPDLEWRRKKFEEVYAAFKAKPVGELPGSLHCRGQFGGVPVRIAIGGKEPPRMLPEQSNGVSDVVRGIVEKLDERGKDV